MTKAAIGNPGNIERWGTDAQVMQLAYPQRSLNHTAVADATGLGNDVQNCLLAIVCSPSTTEVAVVFIFFSSLPVLVRGTLFLQDSYHVNASAVDRGLFLRYATRYYKATSSPPRGGPSDGASGTGQWGGSVDVIGLPSAELLRQCPEKYAHLDADGLVRVGQLVEPGMILIAMQQTTNNRVRDVSVQQRCGERGRVTKVVIAEGSRPDVRCVTVAVRSWLRVAVGDKLQSSAQKGTVGLMSTEEDMIFDPVTGAVPQVILNPHSLRRNTQAFLPSMLHADAALRSGANDADLCDAFAESALDALRRAGLQAPKKLRRMMIDGKTGEPLQATVLMGYKDIQTLKQIASWKKSMRGPTGPRTLLGRSPTQGRQRGGGLRWGTQERSLAIALGTSALQQESLRDLSCPTTAYVCYDCGHLARHNDTLDLYTCDMCACAGGGQPPRRVVPVSVSHTLLLVVNELAAMNISMRFAVSPPASAQPVARPLVLPGIVMD